MRLIDEDELKKKFIEWLPKEGKELLECDIPPLKNPDANVLFVTMYQNVLVRYCELMDEIKDLRARIKKLDMFPENLSIVSDTVLGTRRDGTSCRSGESMSRESEPLVRVSMFRSE